MLQRRERAVEIIETKLNCWAVSQNKLRIVTIITVFLCKHSYIKLVQALNRHAVGPFISELMKAHRNKMGYKGRILIQGNPIQQKM